MTGYKNPPGRSLKWLITSNFKTKHEQSLARSEQVYNQPTFKQTCYVLQNDLKWRLILSLTYRTRPIL